MSTSIVKRATGATVLIKLSMAAFNGRHLRMPGVAVPGGRGGYSAHWYSRALLAKGSQRRRYAISQMRLRKQFNAT